MTLYIAFEGIDGSGKSKQLTLFSNYLKTQNYTVFETSELGSLHDTLCIKTRDLVLNNNYNIDELVAQYLLAASSIQHSEKVLKPQLGKVDFIISDRSIESNLAYGYASILDKKIIDTIFCLDKRRIVPDLIIYLDVDPLIAANRRSYRKKELFDNNGIDRIENKNMTFQESVRDNYLSRSTLNNKYLIIKTDKLSIEETHLSITNIFSKWVENTLTR